MSESATVPVHSPPPASDAAPAAPPAPAEPKPVLDSTGSVLHRAVTATGGYDALPPTLVARLTQPPHQTLVARIFRHYAKTGQQASKHTSFDVTQRENENMDVSEAYLFLKDFQLMPQWLNREAASVIFKVPRRACLPQLAFLWSTWVVCFASLTGRSLCFVSVGCPRRC